MKGLRRALVAVAAGLALADASIVALALPPILAEMDTTITGVAAIIGVYALVLAVAIWPAARLRVGPWGFALFAAASLACGLAGSLGLLLVFRALQAAGGAAALLAAFSVLDAGESRSGRRLWLGAALVGTAAGPAIGGALTEAFDWRAIFIVQAPLAAAAAIACRHPAVVEAPRGEARRGGAAPAADEGRGGAAPAAGEGRGGAAPAAAGEGRSGAAPAAAGEGRGGAAPAAAGGERREEGEPAGGLWSRSEGAQPDGESRGDAERPPAAPAPARGDWAAPPPGVSPAEPPPAGPGGGGAPVPGRDSARATDLDSGAPNPAEPAPAGRGADPVAPRREPARVAPAAVSPIWLAALAFTAAAFTAVLFLLVIELVAGFAMSPLRAALGVAILPLAALAGAAIPGAPRPKALAGATLIAGGAAALAFLPAASIAWTVVPQLLAGAGMGLALPAFSGERNVAEAARNLVARHAGIVVVLALLAPVATAQLETTTDRAILQGASLVLDARIDPLQKLQLAPALLDDVDVDSPRAGLTRAVEQRRAEFADDAAVYDRLAGRLDDVVVVAVQDAFRAAYLIAAALALLGAALLSTAWRKPAVWLAAATAAVAVAVYVVEKDTQAPAPVALQDPCQERQLPEAGDFSGRIQNEALRLLDRGACEAGTSREELALALFDRERAAEFEREHGVNPRSVGGLLSILGG
jgi:MFS family permease